MTNANPKPSLNLDYKDRFDAFEKLFISNILTVKHTLDELLLDVRDLKLQVGTLRLDSVDPRRDGGQRSEVPADYKPMTAERYFDLQARLMNLERRVQRIEDNQMKADAAK